MSDADRLCGRFDCEQQVGNAGTDDWTRPRSLGVQAINRDGEGFPFYDFGGQSLQPIGNPDKRHSVPDIGQVGDPQGRRCGNELESVPFQQVHHGIIVENAHVLDGVQMLS